MTTNGTAPNQTAEEAKPGSDLSEAAKMKYLTPSNAAFTKSDGGMLDVKVDGEEHKAVYAHCSFPHTNRSIYVSIRNLDNKELGMIRTLDEFPPDTKQLLEEQVRIRYFSPEITKVVRVKEEFGYAYWEAETTAGLCRFTVRSGGGNTKLITTTRLLITDVDGNRFVIPDLGSLSDKEYRMVEMCM
ncbi:DUF1854 domain-containing protein [Paenibacillus silvisoli]|uniref:DUF1854 domain-containing protein n=1 Tax=Paenibacillus silvisoli TaxID=3110539 RepID=UPI0028050FC0|nr:DUF1854 domain-containing protein [Paenibacillus silvisoli]